MKIEIMSGALTKSLLVFAASVTMILASYDKSLLAFATSTTTTYQNFFKYEKDNNFGEDLFFLNERICRGPELTEARNIFRNWYDYSLSVLRVERWLDLAKLHDHPNFPTACRPSIDDRLVVDNRLIEGSVELHDCLQTFCDNNNATPGAQDMCVQVQSIMDTYTANEASLDDSYTDRRLLPFYARVYCGRLEL